MDILWVEICIHLSSWLCRNGAAQKTKTKPFEMVYAGMQVKNVRRHSGERNECIITSQHFGRHFRDIIQ